MPDQHHQPARSNDRSEHVTPSPDDPAASPQYRELCAQFRDTYRWLATELPGGRERADRGRDLVDQAARLTDPTERAGAEAELDTLLPLISAPQVTPHPAVMQAFRIKRAAIVADDPAAIESAAEKLTGLARLVDGPDRATIERYLRILARHADTHRILADG